MGRLGQRSCIISTWTRPAHPKCPCCLITGTVGAGKTAVAREIGELLRLTRVAGGMRMVCGVIDLDALSYVAAGPVEDRCNSNFVVENLKAIWPNYAARGVDHLVLARYTGAAHEVEGYREAIPSATVTVASPLRRRSCRTVCVDGSAGSHEIPDGVVAYPRGGDRRTPI